MALSKGLKRGVVVGLSVVVVVGGGLLLLRRRVPMLWAIPASSSPGIDTESWEPVAPVDEATVLYVGHSLVGPVLPSMVEAVASSLGSTLRARAQRIDGGSMRVNWEEPERADGVDAKRELRSGRFDVLVLTEAVNLDDHLRWSDPPGYARRWAELARSHRPGTRLYLYETWHDRSESRRRFGVIRSDDWRANLEDDLGRWEHIVDEAERGGEPLGFHVLPGGQAMAALHDAVSAGAVPGVSRMDAFFQDTVHPNALGFYFMALVHVATILRRSPEGATAEVPLGDVETFRVPTDTARALQEIAWRAVGDYPRSGVRVEPRD